MDVLPGGESRATGEESRGKEVGGSGICRRILGGFGTGGSSIKSAGLCRCLNAMRGGVCFGAFLRT